jgi:hypothetical protein
LFEIRCQFEGQPESGAVALICSGKRTAQQTKGPVALKKPPAPLFFKGTDVGAFAFGEFIRQSYHNQFIPVG